MGWAVMEGEVHRKGGLCVGPVLTPQLLVTIHAGLGKVGYIVKRPSCTNPPPPQLFPSSQEWHSHLLVA